MLVVSFVAMGAIFGATDVSVVAFTDELGHKNLAGLVLAVFALGSGLAGFVYGARHWSGPLWRRYAVGMVALGTRGDPLRAGRHDPRAHGGDAGGRDVHRTRA